jgi:hypothetical protein
MAKKPFAKAPLGSGARFAACVRKMTSKGKSSESAKKICATIGRKTYGKKGFAALSAKGKKK